MAACLNCGAQLQDGARFCASCGATLGAVATPPPAAVCQRCAAPLAADAVFCPSCGLPVSQPAAAPVVAVAPPAPSYPQQPPAPVYPQPAPAPSYPQQPPAPAYPQQSPAQGPYQQPAQAWPAYAPPQSLACLACGSALRPGARFCRACGTVVGSAAPPPPQWQQQAGGVAAKPQLDVRTIVMGVAFALVFVGAFMDWISANGVGVKPFDEIGYFRITDWLVSDNPTSPPPHWDGIVTIVLAALGLAACGLSAFTAGGLRSAGKLLLGIAGPLVAAFFSLELQYILSRPNSNLGIGDIGIGLWLIGAAAAIATVVRFIPAAQR